MGFATEYALQKQINAVMEILCEENDEVTFVNYYLEARDMIKSHFTDRGVVIADQSAYAMVRSIVKIMLEMLPHPQQFIETSRSRDVFSVLKKVLQSELKKI